MGRVGGEDLVTCGRATENRESTTPKWCATRPATAQPVEHLHGMQGVRFEPSIALLQVDFFGAAASLETARLWPNAASLKGVSDERERKAKRKPAPVFWTVGVDEISTG